jgi:hypothetical protein
MNTKVTEYLLDVQESNLDRSKDFSFRFHSDTSFGIYRASSVMELSLSRSSCQYKIVTIHLQLSVLPSFKTPSTLNANIKNILTFFHINK